MRKLVVVGIVLGLLMCLTGCSNKELESKLQSYKDKLETKEVELEKEIIKTKRLEGEVNNLKNEVDKLKTQVQEFDKLKKENTESKTENDNLKRQVSQLEDDKRQLESQLQKTKPANPDEAETEIQKHHAHALELLRDAKYQEAIQEYKKILDVTPDDETALYNTACAYSLLGDKKNAVEFLIRAVKAGFTDFEHIQNDKDLDNIRDEEEYKALIRDKEKHSQAPVEGRIKKLKERLGEEYLIETMEDYKLVVVSNVSKASLESLKRSLTAFANAHWKDLFKHKPSYYITILIPKSMDDYVKKFGGQSGAAGFYNPNTRTLTVNLSTGTGTMIHEFTHALHYADMVALKQTHPQWIVEGFGSLYEQCSIKDGSGYGLLNWRLPGLQSALNTAKYIKWRDLMEKSSAMFRQNAALSYAEARYIFYYLQEKNLLRKFYQEYTQNYKDDPTGIKVIESLLGKPLEEIEKEWIPWVEKLQQGGGKPQGPVLGISTSSEESDKGVIVETVAPDSGADKAGIKKGDIITELDGKKISTFEDLRKVLSDRKAGDTIKIKILRGSEEQILDVTLGKR